MTLTAVLPAERRDEYQFDGWKGVQCRRGLQLQRTCTFAMPKRRVTVRALFARRSWTHADAEWPDDAPHP
jgi:List-Bact-rpt repeat protein